MRPFVLIPIVAVALVLGCSSKEDIRAESAGATGTGGHKMQGAGGGPSSTAAATSGAGGSGAGSCCSEPVHVAGKVKTITADTDVDQQVSGMTMTGIIAPGPFILTDLVGTGNAWVSDSGPCPTTEPAALVVSGGGPDHHGLHVFVPANSTLCTYQGSPITFSGFKPY